MISVVGKEERLAWIQYKMYQLKEKTKSRILERNGIVGRKVPVATILDNNRKVPSGEMQFFCLYRMSGRAQWTKQCGKHSSKQTSLLLSAAGERRENI